MANVTGPLAPSPEEQAAEDSLLGRVGRGFTGLMNNPRAMAGLGGIAQGLLQASAVSNRPISWGEAMGLASQGANQRLGQYDQGEQQRMMAALKTRQLEQSNAPSIGSYNPRDYTTDSFAKFRATGDSSVLVRYEPYAIQDIGGVPYRVDKVTGEPVALATLEQVAESEATISGAKEDAKLREQSKYLPGIKEQVRLAEERAKARGETLTELRRLEASMPGLQQAVSDLKELAPLATSTIGGKFWDQAVKQTGFGATDGATARAKFIAIVDNQVLPLLKETFGAAFTAQEGEALKATMGDPDASPEEKLAQLDAFIAQKLRTIEAKRSELTPQPAAPAQPGQVRFLGFE